MRSHVCSTFLAFVLGCCLVPPVLGQHRKGSCHCHDETPPPSRVVKVSIDSGKVANPGQRRAPVVVFRRRIDVKNAHWLRLMFSDVVLSGDPGSGSGSYLRIASLKDNAVQYLNAEHVEQWQGTSAYFNGDAIMLELIAYPGTGVNRVALKNVIAGELAHLEDSICGLIDDRTLSNDMRAARHLPEGCTTWLFNDLNKTFLTAGHCGVSSGDVQQFNVPLSSATGTINHPPPEDQYVVEPSSVQLLNGGIGNDWCYFGVFPNSTTGLTPFQAQGGFYNIAAAPPVSGQTIRITGYGVVSAPVSPTWNQVQKTHTGPYVARNGTQLQYAVDTTGGNSGSAVFNENTMEAIGIHTHGGCSATGGANSGTALQQAGLQTALANPRGICASGRGTVSPPLYVAGDLNNNFGTANIATGQFGKVSQITAQIQGLAYDRNTGVFFGTDRSKLYTIEPAAGSATAVGTISGTTSTINGLGYDPNARVLYAIEQSTGQLYRIDTATGAATPIGGPGAGNVGALEYDSESNKLYGLDDSGAGTRLVEIDTTLGTQTGIGLLGAGITDCNGLAFDPQTDQLYTINAGNEQLLRVDQSTGVATLVGPTSGLFGAVYGMGVAAASEPVRVIPMTFTLFRGVLVSGNLQSLHNADDNRLVARPGVVLNQAERPIQLIIEGAAPGATASAMKVVVEAHCNIVNISQRVEAFNFAANSYTQLDERNLPTSDLRLELDVPNPSQHIGPGNALRARISYKEAGPIFSYPWFARIDETIWTLIP